MLELYIGMNSDDLYRKGMNLLEERKFQNALSYFEQALIENPNDPDLLNGKGAALRSLAKYDEAMECFNRSLQIDPRDKHAS